MRRVVLCATALFAAACGGPVGPFPGGRLDGALATAPIDDWSFARNWTLSIETDPDAPRSVNVHFVTDGPRLWVATVLGGTSSWARRTLADGRVRVRISGAVYERQAVAVGDRSEIEHVAALYREKYTLTPDVTGEGTLIFRLDPR